MERPSGVLFSEGGSPAQGWMAASLTPRDLGKCPNPSGRLEACRYAKHTTAALRKYHRYAHRTKVRRLGGSGCQTIAHGKALSRAIEPQHAAVEILAVDGEIA